MTREEAKYASEVMEAYADGKTVQLLQSNNWIDVDGRPTFNWNMYKYRIKPDPKYVPFTYEDREQLRGKWIKYKSNGKTEYQIISIDRFGINTQTDGISYNNLLELMIFIDGSPCGKVVE